MSSPLLIRPHTKDINVFVHVYGNDCYRVDVGLEPDIILDLGAYTGLSTRWLADRYPDAEIIAVEADPALIPLLEMNAPMAEVHNVAVAAECGTATLHRHTEEWRTSLHGTGGDTPVRTSTVDAVLAGRMPDVVKMDIEGSEKEVFEAGGRWLYGVRVILLETHDRFVPGCENTVRTRLNNLGRHYTWERRGGADVTIRFGGRP